jgi:hypothetical protein
MLKSILRGIYFLFMGPVYRRLQRELTLENQVVKKELLLWEEQFTARVMNETVQIISGLQHQKVSNEQRPIETFEPVAEGLGANQIGDIMQSLKGSRDIVKISRDAKIPMAELLDLQNRYGGMDGLGVKRVRQLEAENLELKHMLSDFRLRIEMLESELATTKTPGMVSNVEIS